MKSVLATHRITDDSRYLAIIDPDSYHGFVHEDWTLDLLRDHFVKQMAARRILIWGTGLEMYWKIQVAFQPTGIAGFREAIGSIVSSRGRLLLTNFESLTMAAAYADVSLPQRHEANNVMQVQPGLYDSRIIQLSDPTTSEPFEEPVNFVYEFTRVTEGRAAWNRIPWASL
jgi:hypothetical protein